MEREQWDERYRVDELTWRAEPNRFLVEKWRLPLSSSWSRPTRRVGATGRLVRTRNHHVPAPAGGRTTPSAAPSSERPGPGCDIARRRARLHQPHRRYWRAQDPAVLFGPEDIVGDLDGLEIERAERTRRPVATDDGEVDAIDAIVRAVRPA